LQGLVLSLGQHSDPPGGRRGRIEVVLGSDAIIIIIIIIIIIMAW
jgi:hypothetical protein